MTSFLHNQFAHAKQAHSYGPERSPQFLPVEVRSDLSGRGGQIASYCMKLGSVPGNLTIFVFKFNSQSSPAWSGTVILF